MMSVFAKVFFAVVTGGFGYWLWHSANAWKAKGEIPAIWNEGSDLPAGSDQPGFAAFIVWQKVLTGLLWVFCAMCVSSIILGDLLGFF
jgi:hypothetical protein